MSGAFAGVHFASGQFGTLEDDLPDGVDDTEATWQLSNDGTYTISSVESANWVVPGSYAAFFQVKVDVTDGAFSSGDNTGEWLDLSTTRSWVVSVPATVTFTVSIREKATQILRTEQAGKTLTVTDV